MKGLSSYEIRQLILSVGTHKSERPLSPVEVAKFMRRTLDMGEKRAAIADRLHLDDSSIIGRFVRLLSLPVQVQHLIGWGSDPATVSFTAASDIARLDSPQEQSALAKVALESQLNKSEIVQVVQIRLRSGKSIESCVKAVLNQRPVIERRHVIIGELQSVQLKEKLKQMSQLERNSLPAICVRTIWPQYVAFRIQAWRSGTFFWSVMTHFMPQLYLFLKDLKNQ